MTSPFNIIQEYGQLRLSDCVLPHDQESYLRQYLDQVNRYRAIGYFQGSPVFSLYQPPLALPSGIRSLLFRLKRRFGSLRVPATATIAVNKACQCDCEHCSAVFYNSHHRREMSFEILIQALSETSQLGVTNMILLGGEPLLRKDLSRIIASVPKDLSVVTLFTNGEFLTRVRAYELKESGLMGAFISLDDTHEKKHDAGRKRPGLFRKAVEGIGYLKEAGVLVAISSYLSPAKLKEESFEQMMELGKELGVNEVTFFDAIPSGQWLRDTSFLLTAPDRDMIREKVRYYRSQEGYPGLSVQSTMTSECGSAFCFAANTQFYLTAFGDMCPCDFTPLSIGSYPEESLLTLWTRMTTTPPYDQRSKSCRMQSADFRNKYIAPIPLSGPYPYPMKQAMVDIYQD